MKHGIEESEMMLAAAVACEQVERIQKGPRASHPCSRIWSWSYWAEHGSAQSLSLSCITTQDTPICLIQTAYISIKKKMPLVLSRQRLCKNTALDSFRFFPLLFSGFPLSSPTAWDLRRWTGDTAKVNGNLRKQLPWSQAVLRKLNQAEPNHKWIKATYISVASDSY